MLAAARRVQTINASACKNLRIILRRKDGYCYSGMFISIDDMINGYLFGDVVYLNIMGNIISMLCIPNLLCKRNLRTHMVGPWKGRFVVVEITVVHHKFDMDKNTLHMELYQL